MVPVVRNALLTMQDWHNQSTDNLYPDHSSHKARASVQTTPVHPASHPDAGTGIAFGTDPGAARKASSENALSRAPKATFGAAPEAVSDTAHATALSTEPKSAFATAVKSTPTAVLRAAPETAPDTALGAAQEAAGDNDVQDSMSGSNQPQAP